MNLISKKDLLAVTGISYGQLYRWKRERLIPEEWFIKQSAYTGQETFFPREQILSRIKSILDMKDLYSLEELAKILSPETSVNKISRKNLEEIDEIDQRLIDFLPEVFDDEEYGFLEVAITAAISKLSHSIGLSEAEMKDLLNRSASAASGLKAANMTCTVFLAGNEYHTVFTTSPAELTFDRAVEVKERVSVSEISDAIKIKYKSLFAK